MDNNYNKDDAIDLQAIKDAQNCSNTLLICVNVYCSFATLQLQLETIQKFVKSMPYVVILSCNQFMFDLLQTKTKELPKNVLINPEIINKHRHHGSVFRGIVSNMLYAFQQKISFEFCVILSGRTIFYRELSADYLRGTQKKWRSMAEMVEARKHVFTSTGWYWGDFCQTELGKYYLTNGFLLQGGAHEGLSFSFNVCKNIILFLYRHHNMRVDLFNFPQVMEEFALHTIALNEVDEANMEFGFTYIGNGCSEDCDWENPHKFTRKIPFIAD